MKEKWIPLGLDELEDSYEEETYGKGPVIEVTEEGETIRLSYIFPGFTVSEAHQDVDGEIRTFEEVGISGVGFISETGKPLLPSFGRYVQIPMGCDFEVEVETGPPVHFDDLKGLLVTPAQEDAKDKGEAKFEYDDGAYSSEASYPEEVVVWSGPQNLDGYRAILIHVRPLQYNPVEKSLRGYQRVVVTIRLSRPDQWDVDGLIEFAFDDPRVGKDAFGNLLLNPQRGITRRLTTVIPNQLTVPYPLPWGPELIIIYYDGDPDDNDDQGLKAPAERLQRWKLKKGIWTELKPISKIGNDVEKIKAFIRAERSTLLSRLRYVLLMGDSEQIVTENRKGITTDHYFFTMTDETHEADCVLPVVSGGRIPVSNAVEGNAVVDQIIQYEKEPPCNPDYYRRMTVAAYFQDRDPRDGKDERAYIKTMETIRKHMEDQGFSVERVYVTDQEDPKFFSDGTPVPPEVLHAIVEGEEATQLLIEETRDGQSIVGHRDHGEEGGWIHPKFGIDQLKDIEGEFPSIFFSINCLTGRFDADPTASFAVRALVQKGGPPSMIASTEESGTWRNDSLIKALFDSLWPGVIPTFPGDNASYAVKYNRLGDILNYAKSYLLVHHGMKRGVREHLEMYHVLGDPTLEIWAEEPKRLGLSASVRDKALHLRLSSCPAGAFLSIWDADEGPGSESIKGVQPSSTSISFPLRELLRKREATPMLLSRPRLRVCLSAPGFRFTEAKVRV